MSNKTLFMPDCQLLQKKRLLCKCYCHRSLQLAQWWHVETGWPDRNASIDSSDPCNPVCTESGRFFMRGVYTLQVLSCTPRLKTWEMSCIYLSQQLSHCVSQVLALLQSSNFMFTHPTHYQGAHCIRQPAKDNLRFGHHPVVSVITNCHCCLHLYRLNMGAAGVGVMSIRFRGFAKGSRGLYQIMCQRSASKLSCMSQQTNSRLPCHDTEEMHMG